MLGNVTLPETGLTLGARYCFPLEPQRKGRGETTDYGEEVPHKRHFARSPSTYPLVSPTRPVPERKTFHTDSQSRDSTLLSLHISVYRAEAVRQYSPKPVTGQNDFRCRTQGDLVPYSSSVSFLSLVPNRWSTPSLPLCRRRGPCRRGRVRFDLPTTPQSFVPESRRSGRGLPHPHLHREWDTRQ